MLRKQPITFSPKSSPIFAKDLKGRDRYEYVTRLRKSRAKFARKTPELKAIIKWINKIQIALGLNDDKFAKLLGLSSPRMIRAWRNSEGYLPSKRRIKKLEELERVSRIIVERETNYVLTGSKLARDKRNTTNKRFSFDFRN